MSNWVQAWLAQSDLSRYPIVQLAPGALHVRRPGGEYIGVFTGDRISYRTTAGARQPLTTTLGRGPGGAWSAPGLCAQVDPAGVVTCGGFAQQTTGVQLRTGGRVYPLATFGPGRIMDDCLLREAPGLRLATRLLPAGVSETLTLTRDWAGDGVLELTTHTQGRLPAGWRVRPAQAWSAAGARLPLVRTPGGWGLPGAAARAGAVLDPDYAADSADGYTYGEALTWADARDTAYGYGVSGAWFEAGQQWADGTYRVWRSLLKFDTRSLPTYVAIDDVRVKLACSSDASTTDFDVLVVKANWSATDPITGGNKTTNHQLARDAASAGVWRNTSGLSTDTVYTSAALTHDWVTAGGYTYGGLRSSRDGVSSPGGNEMIQLHAQEAATAGFRPVLAVTYHMAYPRALLGVGR